MQKLTRESFLASLPILAAATQSAAGQEANLRVGATANDNYGEAYFAEDTGIFAKAGLKVDISTFSNGNAIATAVASGALDLGVTNPVALGNAVAHGIPFVYFAGGAIYDTAAPTTLFCVAKNGPIQKPKDLEGKTIANQTAKDLGTLVFGAYLEKNAVDPSKVQIVEVPMTEMGSALERGTVAGAIISEPQLSVAINSGQARAFAKLHDFIAPHFHISGWFTTRDCYAKNVQLAQRYAAATYATARWANIAANREKSADILAKYAKLDPMVVRKVTRARFDDALRAAYLDPPLALAAKANFTPRHVSASELMAT